MSNIIQVRKSFVFTIRMRISPIFRDAVQDELNAIKTKYETASTDHLETCVKCNQDRLCEFYYDEADVLHPLCAPCKAEIERWQTGTIQKR